MKSLNFRTSGPQLHSVKLCAVVSLHVHRIPFFSSIGFSLISIYIQRVDIVYIPAYPHIFLTLAMPGHGRSFGISRFGQYIGFLEEGVLASVARARKLYIAFFSFCVIYHLVWLRSTSLLFLDSELSTDTVCIIPLSSLPPLTLSPVQVVPFVSFCRVANDAGYNDGLHKNLCRTCEICVGSAGLERVDGEVLLMFEQVKLQVR